MADVIEKRKYDWLNAWSITVMPVTLLILTFFISPHFPKDFYYALSSVMYELSVVCLIVSFMGAGVFLVLRKKLQEKKRIRQISQIVLNSLISVFVIWVLYTLHMAANYDCCAS